MKERDNLSDGCEEPNSDSLRTTASFNNTSEGTIADLTDIQVDDKASLLRTENVLPKFQPGDHVVRWKMIKAILWPIQVHGIVLSSEMNEEDGTCTVVIADFGFSSTQDGSKKKGLVAINDMMRNFYDGKKGESGSITTVGNDIDDDGIEKYDDKRFHLRTISDPSDLKKWNKVNYGHSLFSSAGKLDKLKKMFKIPQTKKGGEETQMHSNDYPASASMDASDDDDDDNDIDNDSFFKSPNEGETGKTAEASPLSAAIKKVFHVPKSEDHGYSSLLPSENQDILHSASLEENRNNAEEIIKQPNQVERRNRPWMSAGLYNRSSRIGDDSSVSSLASSKSIASTSNRPIKPIQSMNNLLKKLSFQNRSKSDSYDKIPDSFQQDNKNRNVPKLPKSDPRAIVLARVRYILAQQNKPENESSLPKYHILYSNSECLAVWCKTGKFSTLQAAVFLHSTAVGNAKSSIMLGAGVAATQPWLIPVVGVYAIAAVGMPYYVLNQCKTKWKESEMRLTTSFWEDAGAEVYVSAIENWSGLTPDKQEDADEVGMIATKESQVQEQCPDIVQV